MSVANFVANPGFEVDPVSDKQGGAWSTNIWGAGMNVPENPFSLELVDVYEGARAMRCEVSDPAGNQFVVGQMTSQMRGVLIPSKFVPGETYTLQVAYESTIDLRLMLQASSAGVKLIDTTIIVPASSVWMLSPMITVTWPEGIDYIQWFLMNPNRVGYFIVDSASLMGMLAPTIYSVTITVEGFGVTDPAPGVYSAIEGDIVTVLATPDAEQYFAGWYLNGVPYQDNPITFQVNQNVTLRAVFKPIAGEPPSALSLLAVAAAATIVLLKPKT